MPADVGRSLGDVLQDIVANVQDIVRSELRLAAVEGRQELAKAANAGKIGGAGAVLALFALAFFLLAGVYALAIILPIWAASLIVAAVLAIAASILITAGKRRLKLVHSKPRKTIASIKETFHGGTNR